MRPSSPPGGCTWPRRSPLTGSVQDSVRSWPRDGAAEVGAERVSADLEAPPDAGSGGSRRPPKRPRRTAHSFAGALGLTVLGAVVPGTGFLAAGRRRLGALTLVLFVLLVGGALYLGAGGRRAAGRRAGGAGAGRGGGGGGARGG